MFLKHVKHGRPCFLKIWTIECYLKSNIECSILLLSSCELNINNNDALIPTSTSTSAGRAAPKMDDINFDLLHWTTPSSPQQPQPIDEQEDISSILEGIPLLSHLPPDVTDVTSMSSGEEMNTSPPDSHGIIKYFNDDPMIPIFDSYIRSLDTKNIVEYVLSGVDVDKTAKLVPSRPTGNYNFVYDTDSDDFGVWRPSGTKTLFYTTEIDHRGLSKVKHGPKEGTGLRAKKVPLCASKYAHIQKGCGDS